MIPTETAESLRDTRGVGLKLSRYVLRRRDVERSAQSGDAIAKDGGAYCLSSWLHLSVRCQAQRQADRSLESGCVSRAASSSDVG